MKKQGVAPNFCHVLSKIKIEFKIKYSSHTLFNYNIQHNIEWAKPMPEKHSEA